MQGWKGTYVPDESMYINLLLKQRVIKASLKWVWWVLNKLPTLQVCYMQGRSQDSGIEEDGGPLSINNFF
jgi:hypothetical protein